LSPLHTHAAAEAASSL